MDVAAGTPLPRGIARVSGKWSALRRSEASCRRSLPGRALARVIALSRPAVEREARYDATVVPGSPSLASEAIDGVKTW